MFCKWVCSSGNRVHEALDMAIRRTENERTAQLLKNYCLSWRKCYPADVVIIEAQGNYVLLQRPSGSYLRRESIPTMAEKLKAYGFIRIHRSLLVNGSFVEEIQPWPAGEYVLRIKGGKEYTVSRTYKSNLKSWQNSGLALTLSPRASRARVTVTMAGWRSTTTAAASTLGNHASIFKIFCYSIPTEYDGL
jgi:LytTr DNA-binding domain